MEEAGPIEVTKFMLGQQGLKRKDLIPFIGSASRVPEVLNGRRNLNLSTMRWLSETLGVPMDQAPNKKRALSLEGSCTSTRAAASATFSC